MAEVLLNAINSSWKVSDQESEFIDRITSAEYKNRWHIPSYKVGSWDGYVRMWNPKSKTLPAGLVHDCVRELERFGHEVSIYYEEHREPNSRPDSYINYDITADHQLYALQALLDNKRGIVHAATNAGKTKIIQAWCAMVDLKILYLVPSIELLEQTLKSFKEDTNLDVGYISAQKGWRIGEDVTICLATSVAKRKSSKTGKIINEKVVKKFKQIAGEFEAVVVDECHHMTGDTWRWILRQLKNAHYRYGLSGTPWEEGDKVEELYVKSLLGPVIANVTNDELINVGWSAKPKIKMIRVDSPKLKFSREVEFIDIYEQGIVYNDTRNNLIIELCERLSKEGKSCLIVSVRIAQCQILRDLLSARGIEHRVITGQTNSFIRKENLEEFKAGSFPILISNVLSEGIDVPSLNALIFASGGKSQKKTLQRIGRGIRKKKTGENIVEIYDFQDHNHQFLRNHTTQRHNLYKSENFEIEILEGKDVYD